MTERDEKIRAVRRSMFRLQTAQRMANQSVFEVLCGIFPGIERDLLLRTSVIQYGLQIVPLEGSVNANFMLSSSGKVLLMVPIEWTCGK